LDKKGGKGPAGGSTKGDKTREEIIARAMRIAAIEGLGALSIGRLAKALRMSKSGLFVHFGSKEKLEIAVIGRAHQIFNGRIFASAEEKGIERVWALCDRWLKFVESQVLPGGYLFTGAFFERAPQDGDVAQRIRQIIEEWLKSLRRAIDQAQSREEIRSEIDAKRTAFELNSLLIGAQWSYLLSGTDYGKARSAILARLRSLATEDIPTKAFDSESDWKEYLKSRHN
jgi:AcrR family transcriptional regulator